MLSFSSEPTTLIVMPASNSSPRKLPLSRWMYASVPPSIGTKVRSGSPVIVVTPSGLKIAVSRPPHMSIDPNFSVFALVVRMMSSAFRTAFVRMSILASEESCLKTGRIDFQEGVRIAFTVKTMSPVASIRALVPTWIRLPAVNSMSSIFPESSGSLAMTLTPFATVIEMSDCRLKLENETTFWLITISSGSRICHHSIRLKSSSSMNW